MAVPVQSGSTAGGSSPRILSILLGAWLFISAFAWPHGPAQRMSACILGALCVVFSILAKKLPWTQYLNTVLAIWLFISAWALPPENVGTLWNNAIVAIAIFVLSLIPERPVGGAPPLVGHSPPARSV
ncbi:MAG TPA: SPW repeat protein [Polyangiaceae bacterium]|nr:SPW repeat protein [Polyangiaceae bacterium]